MVKNLSENKKLKNGKPKTNPRINSKRGLVIVYTGSGKGKTTAALGLALRAAGHGQRVLILQFIKGTWKVGELKAIEKLKLAPFVEIEQLGLGFIDFKDGKPVVTEEQKNNALCSFKYACDKIKSGMYDIVVLDEINNLVDYGLLDIKDVIDTVENRPPNLSIVLTGRNAHQRLIEVGDIVTEMREIKHVFNEGIKAKKGIDY